MVGLGIWERPIENHKIKMPFGIKDDRIANNSFAWPSVSALCDTDTIIHDKHTSQS